MAVDLLKALLLCTLGIAGVGALTWGLITNDLDGAGVNLTVLGLGAYVVAWALGLYLAKD